MKNILLILLALPLFVFGQGVPEYQLSPGWNLVGFTACGITPIEEAIESALSNGDGISNTFEIIKDVRGKFWHPSLGEHSSLTQLTPGEGYMMKVVNFSYTTTIQFSQDYCNDITYQLNSGWNFVAFTGDVNTGSNIESSMDNALGNSAVAANTFSIIKSVDGNFWAPGIDLLTQLTPGEAYMMYVYEGQGTTVSFTENSTQIFENNPGEVFDLPTTDNNMSVVFPVGTLTEFTGYGLKAYAVKYTYESPYAEYMGEVPIDSVIVATSNTIVINEDGSAGIPVIGEDGFLNFDIAQNGDVIQFKILQEGDSEDYPFVLINLNPPISYEPNSIQIIGDYSYISDFLVEGMPVEFGCIDEGYLEFNASANVDNGSCEIVIVEGCTDIVACNYSESSNIDNGSCLYLDYEQSLFNACCLGNSITTICILDDDICGDTDIDCITYGCTQLWADNYDPFITQDDASCYRMGCTSPWADNYDDVATTNDGSCFRYGCTFDWANNYDVLATADDASCYRFGCTFDWADNYDVLATNDDSSCYRFGCTFDWADNYDILATDYDASCYKFGCTFDWADNYDAVATDFNESCVRLGCTLDLAVNYDEYATIDDSNCEFDIITNLNISFDAWNITIDLQAGWNMFGYGCPTPIDVAEGLYNHTESILLVKDNNGLAYLPEFGFNGIGDFSPGYGYQIKLSQSIEGFSLCDWYVNDIPGDNIVSMLEENVALQAELDSILGFTEIVEGCTDSLAFNYNSLANIEDNSCNAIVYGCTHTIACDYNSEANMSDGSCEYAEIGYDCDGNITADIGDIMEGGYLFYIDESGEHGLVAALEDITEGSNMGYLGGTDEGFEWGCYEHIVSVAEGQAIGTGYQNTLDIVAQNCYIDNGGISAAQAALNYASEGYTDWHLPSLDELYEMYSSIGQGSLNGNIGNFETSDYPMYWSSSEYDAHEAWYVYHGGGNPDTHDKLNSIRVRAIRAF